MPFKVKEPKELTDLRPGDQVSFRLSVTDTESWIDQVAKITASTPRSAPLDPLEERVEVDSGRYLIRRAVILHVLLCEQHKAGGISPPHPLLDKKLAEAFMRIEAFKHGVRSLRAILSMAEFCPGKTLFASDLPSRDQLDMHVDARHFRELVGGGA